jgi:hypothetical protein
VRLDDTSPCSTIQVSLQRLKKIGWIKNEKQVGKPVGRAGNSWALTDRGDEVKESASDIVIHVLQSIFGKAPSGDSLSVLNLIAKDSTRRMRTCLIEGEKDPPLVSNSSGFAPYV